MPTARSVVHQILRAGGFGPDTVPSGYGRTVLEPARSARRCNFASAAQCYPRLCFVDGGRDRGLRRRRQPVSPAAYVTAKRFLVVEQSDDSGAADGVEPGNALRLSDVGAGWAGLMEVCVQQSLHCSPGRSSIFVTLCGVRRVGARQRARRRAPKFAAAKRAREPR